MTEKKDKMPGRNGIRWYHKNAFNVAVTVRPSRKKENGYGGVYGTAVLTPADPLCSNEFQRTPVITIPIRKKGGAYTLAEKKVVASLRAMKREGISLIARKMDAILANMVINGPVSLTRKLSFPKPRESSDSELNGKFKRSERDQGKRAALPW